MSALRDLQMQLMEALTCATGSDIAKADAATLIALPPPAAAARLQIYRNTINRNAMAALHSTFPAVHRLVGEDYFRHVATGYTAEHPSRSGDLQTLGRDFPGYLAERHLGDEFAYLGDVARFEWLIQEVLLAPEHPPLDLDKLADVAPTAYDSLCFVLHPALRLFDSRYPVRRIWTANVGVDRGNIAEPDRIDLRDGAAPLAVIRQHLQLQFHELSRGEFRLLRGLEQGEAFAAAVTAAAACDDNFDASAALQRFVALRGIVGFR